MSEPVTPTPNPAAASIREAIYDFGRQRAISKTVFADPDRKHMTAYVVHVGQSIAQAMVALSIDALHGYNPERAAELALIWSDLDLHGDVLWDEAGALSEKLSLDWEAIETEGRESWKPEATGAENQAERDGEWVRKGGPYGYCFEKDCSEPAIDLLHTCPTPWAVCRKHGGRS